MPAARMYPTPAPQRAWLLAHSKVPLAAMSFSIETEVVHRMQSRRDLARASLRSPPSHAHAGRAASGRRSTRGSAVVRQPERSLRSAHSPNVGPGHGTRSSEPHGHARAPMTRARDRVKLLRAISPREISRTPAHFRCPLTAWRRAPAQARPRARTRPRARAGTARRIGWRTARSIWSWRRP